MKRERNATAEHDPGGADAGEPEPEDEAKEEFYDTVNLMGFGICTTSRQQTVLRRGN